jgi:hypothetical protein
MIDNYIKLDNGVIKQKKTKPFIYDSSYSKYYDKIKVSSTQMGYLRLGYLLGVLNQTPSSLLDIGYGNGDFLSVASQIVPTCYGYDITDYPIPNGIKKINSLYDYEFDVVSMFDVLEHFEDIYVIKEIKTKYFIISLPECHYFSDEWFISWKHRKPNEHIWHFNKLSLMNFMKEIGFDLVCFSNVEDVIRKSNDANSNILTGTFKKQ